MAHGDLSSTFPAAFNLYLIGQQLNVDLHSCLDAAELDYIVWWTDMHGQRQTHRINFDAALSNESDVWSGLIAHIKMTT